MTVGCIPKDAECCDGSLGSYCEDGRSCLSSTTCDLSGDDSSGDKSSSKSDDGDEEDGAARLDTGFLLVAMAMGVALINPL